MRSGDRRSDALRVRDILRALGAIRSYVHGMNRTQFNKDRRTQDAVVRQIEILGEATKSLSLAFREAVPADDWKKIAGMRDKLAHHYWKTDLDIVWDVAKKYTRRLANALARRRLVPGRTPAQLDAEIAAILAAPKSRASRRRTRS
jgi:uncharacterized protein with HEPN domain